VDHEAVFTFEYPSSERARRVSNAIAPELGDIDDERSRVTGECAGCELTLTVEAQDLIALRAALNTWLSLVRVAEQAGDAL
jgi:KEOPS complex subunit Pcc1